MPVSQNEYLWSGATPILLISPARFFVYKGPKIDYFLSTPLDYRLLFVQSSPRLHSGAAAHLVAARHPWPACCLPAAGCPAIVIDYRLISVSWAR